MDKEDSSQKPKCARREELYPGSAEGPGEAAASLSMVLTNHVPQVPLLLSVQGAPDPGFPGISSLVERL